MSAAPVRILIITGDPASSSGVAASLAGDPDSTIVGEVPPDADLPAAVALSRPDVIVWDLGEEPDPALERMAETEAGVPIVAIIPDEEEGIRALAAGATGLLSRDPDSQHLVAAARAAAAGLLALDPSIVGFIPSLAPSVGPAASAAESETGAGRSGPAGALLIEDLTSREGEVLRLLAEGLPNKAIAGRLGISEHTAKFHVHIILGKLGTQSRTEAVVRAARLGLITL